MSREFVRGFEPDVENDGNLVLVALGDISERNGSVALHFQILRRRFAALRIRLFVRTVDAAYKRVLAGTAFQILNGNRPRSSDRLDEFRGDLAIGHLLCLEARLAVAQIAREDRIAELSGVLGEGGADFDDTVCGFAFGEGHRVIVDPGSGKHDPLQTVCVGIEEFSGIFTFARFEHDTLRREGNHAVLERAILSGRFVHGEIFRCLRCDVPLAHIGKEGQTGRLVGIIDLVRIRGIDIGPDVAVLVVYLSSGEDVHQLRSVGFHAVIALLVRTLVDFKFDFGVRISIGVVYRREVAQNVVAVAAFGLTGLFVGDQFPFGQHERYRKVHLIGTVDRSVARIFDVDIAGVGRAHLGSGETDRKGRLVLSGIECDRLDDENILDVGLHDDRNDDRIHGVAPFDRIGRFGLGSRFELQIGPGSLLLREVDTVAIGILRGSLRIVHVVLAAGKDKKCQQER